MTFPGWKLGILCSKSQININILLNCGQSFRWKQKDGAEWIGVIRDHVWRLCQTERGIFYKVYGQQPMIRIEDIKSKKISLDHKPVVENNGLSELSVEIKKEVDSMSKQETSQAYRNKRKYSNAEAANKKRSITENGQLGDNNDILLDSKSGKKFEIDDVKANKIEYDRNKCSLPSTLLSLGILSEQQVKQIYSNDDVDIQYADDQSSIHQNENCEQVLCDYFQIDVDLCELYNHWSSCDPHFKEVAGNFSGIRMLRQDPTENLLSFVCSSNNHISRISSMVEKLCVHYGKLVAEVDGEKYFSFPKLSDLTGSDVEGHLRELGFGYRAKFISAIARHMTEEGKGDAWLDSLRKCDYKEAKAELIKLMGVGAKVADCVCLMSLDKTEAVPVDTHVWQITLKNYMAKLQSAKSLTEKIYNEIGDFYRDLWGPYAGWAHSVLFTADLKQNKVKASPLKKRPSEGDLCSVANKSSKKNKDLKSSKEMKKGKAK